MKRCTQIVVAGLLVFLGSPAGLLPAAHADVIPPGTHNQRTDVILDFGVYADYATSVYSIRKGDTLEGIAKARLGKASRWKEIATLNPRVTPKQLSVGMNIRVPPRKDPLPAPKAAATKSEPTKAPEAKAGRKHWWHILSVPQPSWDIYWCSHGQPVPVHHYGTSVLAVRNDKLAHFRKLAEDPKQGGYKAIQALMKKPPAWLAVASDVHPGRGNVKSSDPVYRIEKRMRITSIANGRVHTKLLSTKYFGRGGRELSGKAIEKTESRRNWILFLLAAGGLLGLGFVVLRRRATIPATA